MHLAFLRTPAALAGADISCGSMPVLLSLYSLPASSFYILAFLSFRILFFQHFFMSTARRKRGAQINKRNNETHKKKNTK